MLLKVFHGSVLVVEVAYVFVFTGVPNNHAEKLGLISDNNLTLNTIKTPYSPCLEGEGPLPLPPRGFSACRSHNEMSFFTRRTFQ